MAPRMAEKAKKTPSSHAVWQKKASNQQIQCYIISERHVFFFLRCLCMLFYFLRYRYVGFEDSLDIFKHTSTCPQLGTGYH